MKNKVDSDSEEDVNKELLHKTLPGDYSGNNQMEVQFASLSKLTIKGTWSS